MPNPRTWTLPSDLEAAVSATLREWSEQGKVERLWARDATLWTGADEASWLGWLGIADEQAGRVGELRRIAEDVRQAGFTHVLLLGMGGSSLCPEVLRMTFGVLPGWPALSVLDSTDPAQVRAAEARVDLERTLFVVSSKSGTTLEPNIFKQYFFERVQQAIGPGRAGDRFIAITDPGSKLEQAARADGFRHVCFGLPSIGGRYSALSDFGMVPAALMGLDVARLLGAAQAMARACGARGRAEENPGAVLGVILGVLGSRGRDKVTLLASPGIHDLGAWLEQLLAESTGKAGKGLIPVDREPLGPPELYGRDRLFVYLRLQLGAGRRPGPRRGEPRGGRAARGADRGPETVSRSRLSSSAGSSRRPSPARSWGSIRSTSRTSRPARSRRGGSRTRSRRLDACRPKRRSWRRRGSGSSPIRGTRASWRREAGRSRVSCGLTSGGSAPATTRRSSPTSR